MRRAAKAKAAAAPPPASVTCPCCGTAVLLDGSGSALLVPSASWRFEIRRSVKSMNRRMVNARGRAGVDYRKERNAWHGDLHVSRLLAGIPVARKFRSVRLTRMVVDSRSMMDYDDFVGGLKPMVDAMVRAKLLVDDDAKWCLITYHQVVGTTPSKLAAPELRIEISEYD